MKIKQISKLGLVAAFAAVAFASGCSAMSTNDNPVSTEQMAQIRAKEAAGRANFNPAAQPGGQAVKNTAGAGASAGGN
jgi:hypothetical protein